MAKNDGGAAFPTEYHRGDRTGMSLRDWFAGQVIGAVVGATSSGTHRPEMKSGETRIEFAIARDAYTLADAMLAEREKDNG